jgi:DNA recombination protein RmuC
MEVSLILLAVAVIGLAVVLVIVLSKNRGPTLEPMAPRLDALAATQNEIAGRFAQAIAGQADLQKMLAERIEALDKRLGEGLKESSAKTVETLGGIQTRLTVIDEAQKNIAALSGQVVSLQEILSDKQTRGAFGQAQMEAIVADQLPPTHYDFQSTLSNGRRPDCVIRIPNVKGVIVVDSKFPLEAFEAMRGIASDEERKAATSRLRSDILKHVKDIAEKYLIPGEVQTPAIMFVPSESIYAELHTSFSDVVQQARRMQVVIVSPHVFMLAINTIQTLMRDAKMREQAHKIQAAVGDMLQDVKRLGDRVGNLQRHFSQTEGDLKDIVVSTEKIIKRAGAIATAELGPVENDELQATEKKELPPAR